MSEEIKNRKLSLNIVSSKQNHKGFGSGMIDLSNLSSVIIDGEEAYIDVGAIHGKSRVERGIKFSVNKEDVPNGRPCWIVWIAVDRKEEATYYAGVAACEMLIDNEARRGWKLLHEHVNLMDSALKRRIIVDSLGAVEREALKAALIRHNEAWWNASSDELKTVLS